MIYVYLAIQYSLTEGNTTDWVVCDWQEAVNIALKLEMLLGVFGKKRYTTINFVIPLRPQGTNLFPQEKRSLNLVTQIFQNFFKKILLLYYLTIIMSTFIRTVDIY
jgi:hypothetical protein